MINVSATAKYILAKANVKCPPGSTIVKNTECTQACKDLGITKIGKIVNGEDCFKRRDGRCKQNGKHGRWAKLVCKTDQMDGEKEISVVTKNEGNTTIETVVIV